MSSSGGKRLILIWLVATLDDPSLLALVQPWGWDLSDAVDGSGLQPQRGTAASMCDAADSQPFVQLGSVGVHGRNCCRTGGGLARPVLQLAGQGPQFTAGFAEAQRRLLGHGVLCTGRTWKTAAWKLRSWPSICSKGAALTRSATAMSPTSVAGLVLPEEAPGWPKPSPTW